MRIFTMLFYVLVILFGISFAALNSAEVTVNFYIKTVTLPISFLVFLMLGVGILCGFGLFLARYLRVKTALFRLKNQLKWTEKEIKNLRAIPLQDQH